MNQLSNVVDLARYRRAGNGVRRGAATLLRARPRNALICRWRRYWEACLCLERPDRRARSATLLQLFLAS